MDRKLKIGSILLAIGLALISISIIIIAVARPSGSVTATLIVALATPGFILALLGTPMTISSMSPGKRAGLSIGVGIALFAVMVSIVFARVAWLDVAVILSVMSFLLAASLLIVPGIVLLRYQRLATPYFVVCFLIAMTMMWTLIEMLWAAINATDFHKSFYDALPLFLVVGFIAALLTTGAIYGYFEPMRSRRRHAEG